MSSSSKERRGSSKAKKDKKKDKKSHREGRKSRGNAVDADMARLQYSDIDFKEKLGEGSFATVWLAEVHGIRAAVKVIKMEGYMRGELLSNFKKEVDIMKKIRHPNVGMLMGVCVDADTIAIVMEYIEGGSLDDLLEKQGDRIPVNRKILWALDIALGLLWLHQSEKDNPVIHRDLKPENVMIGATGVLKIVDFGLSVVTRGQEKISDDGVPKGSLLWMGPEVLRLQPITTKTDVYAYGLVLWEILCCEKPFQHYIDARDVAGFKRAVKNGERPSFSKCPPATPKALKELMAACWAPSPSDRPDFGFVVKALHKIYLEAVVMDEGGRLFWAEYFGTDREIRWKKFSEALFEHVGRPGRNDLPHVTTVLKSVLTDKEDANVKLELFGRFCALFGPFDAVTDGSPEVFQRIKNLIAPHGKPGYFHGDLSGRDSNSLLTDQPEGTYLLRFSSTQPDCFSVSYRPLGSEGFTISHQLIKHFPFGTDDNPSLRWTLTLELVLPDGSMQEFCLESKKEDCASFLERSSKALAKKGIGFPLKKGIVCREYMGCWQASGPKRSEVINQYG